MWLVLQRKQGQGPKGTQDTGLEPGEIEENEAVEIGLRCAQAEPPNFPTISI